MPGLIDHTEVSVPCIISIITVVLCIILIMHDTPTAAGSVRPVILVRSVD